MAAVVRAAGGGCDGERCDSRTVRCETQFGVTGQVPHDCDDDVTLCHFLLLDALAGLLGIQAHDLGTQDRFVQTKLTIEFCHRGC